MARKQIEVSIKRYLVINSLPIRTPSVIVYHALYCKCFLNEIVNRQIKEDYPRIKRKE